MLEPSDFFHNILERNKYQLIKSIDSPFATGPLSLGIGRDGGRDSTDEILDGSICPNFIDTVDQSKEMKNFIKALREPLHKNTVRPIKELKYTLNIDTYKEIFTKINECTSSFSSRIHYGYYIAAIQDDFLAEVNVIFMRVLFEHEFPLDRCSRSVYRMLQKKLQVYISKLRIIQCCEADFNVVLEYVFWSRLLYYSEEQGITSKTTHGSWPGRSTHNALKINTLTYAT